MSDLLDGIKTRVKGLSKKTKSNQLTIVIKKGDFWADRTLEECTPEEFASWIKFVYPTSIYTGNHFSTLQARQNAFKMALEYHQSLLTVEQRGTLH